SGHRHLRRAARALREPGERGPASPPRQRPNGTAGGVMRRWLLLAAIIMLPAPVLAQNAAQELEQSRRRLEEIRVERERLARQQQRLQGQAHDVADELDNLERQRRSTSRIVDEIEKQITGLMSQVDRSTTELVLAQDNLAERRAVL